VILDGAIMSDQLRCFVTLESYVAEEAHLLMVCSGGPACIFALNQDYIIHEEALDLPGYVAVSYLKRPADHPSEAVGLGVDGSIVFESCRIDQRSLLDNRILVANVTGQFKGTLEIVLLDGSKQHSGLEGYFSIPYHTAGLGAEDVLQEFPEDNCEGGFRTGKLHGLGPAASRHPSRRVRSSFAHVHPATAGRARDPSQPRRSPGPFVIGPTSCFCRNGSRILQGGQVSGEIRCSQWTNSPRRPLVL